MDILPYHRCLVFWKLGFTVVVFLCGFTDYLKEWIRWGLLPQPVALPTPQIVYYTLHRPSDWGRFLTQIFYIFAIQ